MLSPEVFQQESLEPDFCLMQIVNSFSFQIWMVLEKSVKVLEHIFLTRGPWTLKGSVRGYRGSMDDIKGKCYIQHK